MYFLVLAAVFAGAFATPAFDERIAGGQDAAKGAFPYQLSLQFKSGGIIFSHVCGAVAVSPNWALTAARCRDSFDLSKYRVVAGLITQGQHDADSQVRTIDEFILHPKYHGGVSTNDIALLLLSSPLKWTDAVAPAKLPKSGSSPAGEVTLTSWGSGLTLQSAVLPLLSHDECKSALIAASGSVGPFDDTQVCTGPLDGGKGGCSDDLGSPLVQDAVVGVLSWTVNPCGGEGRPAVYTRVDSHLDFILEHVDDL